MVSHFIFLIMEYNQGEAERFQRAHFGEGFLDFTQAVIHLPGLSEHISPQILDAGYQLQLILRNLCSK